MDSDVCDGIHCVARYLQGLGFAWRRKGGCNSADPLAQRPDASATITGRYSSVWR